MPNVNNYPPSTPPSTSTSDAQKTTEEIFEETYGITLDAGYPTDEGVEGTEGPLAPAGDTFGETESALTQDKIRELYKGVQKKVQSGEAEAEDLDKLMRALSAFNQGDEARAQELVNEATGGEAETAGDSSDI